MTTRIALLIFSLFLVESAQAMSFLNVTRKMLLKTANESGSIPIWVLVLVGALVVIFTVLLLFSYKGSNRRRGRKRTIFR